ncbi:MAG: BMP family ABC transporter substrate-binding protein, partial [Clostridiaceae bacterium]|nr:BMP family ABC transporter substrate-binding protein [Clostridiaceae bacterium]
MKKRILALGIALLMLAGILVGCGGKEPAKTEGPDTGGVKKAALLLSGPANDQGWNAIAVAGLDALKEQHGVETAFMENVQVADMEAAYNDYASQGFDMVIGHGFQFGEPAAKVSVNYPDQFFMATESSSKSTNMSSYVM